MEEITQKGEHSVVLKDLRTKGNRLTKEIKVGS
jgi:hypothetical protein